MIVILRPAFFAIFSKSLTVVLPAQRVKLFPTIRTRIFFDFGTDCTCGSCAHATTPKQRQQTNTIAVNDTILLLRSISLSYIYCNALFLLTPICSRCSNFYFLPFSCLTCRHFPGAAYLGIFGIAARPFHLFICFVCSRHFSF